LKAIEEKNKIAKNESSLKLEMDKMGANYFKEKNDLQWEFFLKRSQHFFLQVRKM